MWSGSFRSLQIAKPGTHAMAAAAKKLVEAAVLDKRNERFVLVGDTTGEQQRAGWPLACCCLLLLRWEVGSRAGLL